MSVPHIFANGVGFLNRQDLDDNFAAVNAGIPGVPISSFMSAAQIADVQAGTLTQDMTATLNNALQATLPFVSVQLRNLILDVPGKYRITGPLYLRSGCGLTGQGGTITQLVGSAPAIASTLIVRIGWGLIAGVPTSDNSGLVPFVQGIYFPGLGVACDPTGQAGYRILFNWYSCNIGIVAGGADGLIFGNTIDTSTPIGILLTGQRNKIMGNIFANPNTAIQINTAEFTQVDDNTITDNLFFTPSFFGIVASAGANIGTLNICNNNFVSSNGNGVRQGTQIYILTATGSLFDRINIWGNSFNRSKGNDITVSGGAGILSIENNDFSNTGINDVGTGGYSLLHSIVADQVVGPRWIIRNNTFELVGGASIRLGGAGNVADVSNNRMIGCGTGGAGLVTSANIGDRAHIQVRSGIVDVRISDNSTDSSALYVAGTFNTSSFISRHNVSKFTADIYQDFAGGTSYGERNDGGVMVPSVASAASLVLPNQGCELPSFFITGTTTITSIGVSGWAGRTVRLIFTGILTLTDGSNLKLAGNFVSTADDVVCLTCDGSSWYEVARSVN